MGRFASTVSLYENLRPPYPPAFFRTVAERLSFSQKHALIDLGTGPGLLALGFAPYVGRIVGVDPEGAMLAAARRAAAREGRELTLIEGRAETLAETVGTFEVVTIGRALHWMDRDGALALFDRLLARDGTILVCASFSARDARNPWLEDYNAARRAWSPATLWDESGSGARTHRDLAVFFDASAFRPVDRIKVETSHSVSVGDLAKRVLTFSSSSPEVLGDKAEAMLADVAERLLPFSRDGRVAETLVSTAQVVRRS
jgi:SAM-dependent methyltransferase